MNDTINISCFVDNSSKYKMQAWNLFASLIECRTSAKFHMCTPPNGLSPREQKHFETLGVRIHSVDDNDLWKNPYCNKIQQLFVTEIIDADWILLCDCDTIYVQKPENLLTLGTFEFAAKIVDFPNPPLEEIEAWLARINAHWAGGFANPSFAPSIQTPSLNFNGGMYMISANIARELRENWKAFAALLIEEAPTNSFGNHADQLAMALALQSIHLKTHKLDIDWNFPTHIDTEYLRRLSPRAINMIHYHSNMDDHGLPKLTNIDWIDSTLESVIAKLRKSRTQQFENEIFWNFRYSQYPQLGSGLGTRGVSLKQKHQILSPVFHALKNQSILDFGCGDLELLKDYNFASYLGIDVSEQALQLASEKRPDWTFSNLDLGSFPADHVDASVCLDVLIHIPSHEESTDIINQLIRLTRRNIILSLHEVSSPQIGISFDSAPLLNWLTAQPYVNKVTSLGSLRDVKIILLELFKPNRNQSDITLELMLQALKSTPEDQLLPIISSSRQYLGFFPRTIIRAQEYPWFKREILSHKPARCLDIGAGVSILPILVAQHNVHVDTIDNHELKRNKDSSKRAWNEWGYLDYSAFGPNLSSFDTNIIDYAPQAPYDTIYSVSVIEHMPAKVRRQTLSMISEWLAPGGILLLSVDLERNRDELWNLSEGSLVDSQHHGTIYDLANEIEENNLQIEIFTISRHIPMSRTDVGFIRARKN